MSIKPHSQTPATTSEILDSDIRKKLLISGRERIANARKRCYEKTLQSSALDAAYELAAEVDSIILEFYQAHLDAVDSEFKSSRLAILALGGYGRKTLNLQSDIDILFLTAHSLRGIEEAVIKSTYHMLWDLGMDLGHATRNISQCLEVAGSNLESATALIDSRLIKGNAELYENLMERYTKLLQDDKRDWFLSVKMRNWDERHNRHGSTVYTVEPNVKESEGGLRDYHTLRWLLFALTGNKETRELIDMELLSEEEHSNLLKSIEFLLKIRNLLHHIEGRSSDILSFERQSAVAKLLGYKGDKVRLPEERLMRDFYKHARVIYSLTNRCVTELTRRKPTGMSRLYNRFRRRKIDGHFYVENGLLGVTEDPEDYLLASPNRIMRVFEVASAERVFLQERLKFALASAIRKIDGNEFRRDPHNRQCFLKILGSKGWAEPIIREMYECDVLNFYLPEYEKLYCLAQVDRYHHFTADEHSIRILRFSDELWSHTHEQQTMVTRALHSAAQNVQRWDLLNFALLIHDIGKGMGHRHVLRGGQISQAISDRIGLEENEAELIRFLILKHLRLIHTALRRNLDDPLVIQNFAKEISDVDRLNMLFILTVCDLKAVGPDAWTEWKGSLMTLLYQRTRMLLEGGSLSEIMIEERPDIVPEIMEFLEAGEADEKDMERFVKNLPLRYFASVNTDQMARHFRLRNQMSEECQIVWELIRVDRGKHSVLNVCAADYPGIFSLICGALASKRINIHGAQIFTSRDGWAIDRFMVTDFNNNPIPPGFKLERLRKLLNDIIRGKKSEEQLSKMIPPLEKPPTDTAEIKAPTVIVDNNSSADYTIIEVKTYDQPGLLYHITRAFIRFGLDITVSLITTESYRVVDVFYVTDGDYQKIESQTQIQRLIEILEEELGYTVEVVLELSG